ncbi:unnamed protein product, partial [Rotaria magnacalcarata]
IRSEIKVQQYLILSKYENHDIIKFIGEENKSSLIQVLQCLCLNLVQDLDDIEVTSLTRRLCSSVAVECNCCSRSNVDRRISCCCLSSLSERL